MVHIKLDGAIMNKINFNNGWKFVFNDGKTCTQANNEITYEAEGADILGVASGELTTEEMYTSRVHRVYNGKALIVLKKHEGTKSATLQASTNGLISAEITI